MDWETFTYSSEDGNQCRSNASQYEVSYIRNREYIFRSQGKYNKFQIWK